nr:local transcription regulator [Klebsiella pneumoniae]UZO68849.1 local transcription regulator [Klebsiella pneumoniae]
MFAGKKSAQIREILINESAWEEMTCLFALSLVYVLEATVTEERRRLMMEIIYHKCEFVGEMTVVQQAQRQLSLASYERIEQTLKECIAAKLLPANLLTRRAAVLMRSYLSGLMENWLFAPDSFDLHAEARDYVAILLEMYH